MVYLNVACPRLTQTHIQTTVRFPFFGFGIGASMHLSVGLKAQALVNHPAFRAWRKQRSCFSQVQLWRSLSINWPSERVDLGDESVVVEYGSGLFGKIAFGAKIMTPQNFQLKEGLE